MKNFKIFFAAIIMAAFTGSNLLSVEKVAVSATKEDALAKYEGRAPYKRIIDKGRIHFYPIEKALAVYDYARLRKDNDAQHRALIALDAAVALCNILYSKP